MSDADAQVAASPSIPRLAELGRAVTRAIKTVAEVNGGPSFAASLASASHSVDGDLPADGEVTRGGYRPGDAPQPGTDVLARGPHDRAAGSSLARTLDPASPDLTTFEPGPNARPPIISAIRPEGRSLGPVPAAQPTQPYVAAASIPTSQPVAPTVAPVAQASPAANTVASIAPTTGSAAGGLTADARSTVAAGSATAATPAATSATSTTATASTPAASTTATAATGSSTGSTQALTLSQYPVPTRTDRSGVLNWASDSPPTGRDLDRLIAEARHRRAGWVTFVANPDRLDEYGDLADRLTKAGIQPIARVEDPYGDLPAGDVTALVKELRGHGVRYVQLFDGANVASESPDDRVDVRDYAERWLTAAKAVVAGGGLPGVGALAPKGDYDEHAFLRRFLSAVKERGGTDVLGQAWLALRGEQPGATASTGDTTTLADRAAWFDRVSRQALGRSLPILATQDPAGQPERLSADPASTTPTTQVDQAERALRQRRRSLPALFAASRGTLDAARA